MIDFIKRRGILFGAAFSLLLHIAICIVLVYSKPSSTPRRTTVQLELVTTEPQIPEPTPVEPAAGASQREIQEQQRKRVSSPAKHQALSNKTTAKNVLAVRSHTETPSMDGESPEKAALLVPDADLLGIEKAEPKPVVRSLTFADFERTMGDTAKKDRAEYEAATLEKRREKGAFATEDRRVKAALWKHKSFYEPGEALPLGQSRAAASAYLLTIHRKLSPRFADFLSAFDSPFARIHKKVQDGKLRYNPFYAPPTLADRQAAERGPLSDLSLSAMTEFEILSSGKLGEIRMVRSSASDVFDAGSIKSLLQCSPFDPPPRQLLSRNDRAYIQWTFFRDWAKNTPAVGHVLLLAPLPGSLRLNTDAGIPNE